MIVGYQKDKTGKKTLQAKREQKRENRRKGGATLRDQIGAAGYEKTMALLDRAINGKAA